MENYKVIKVKLNDDSQSSHHLFYRKLSSNDLEQNHLNSRILVVSAVPPYYNEEILKSIFNVFGRIEKVKLSFKPNSNPFATNEPTISYFNTDKDDHEYCFKYAYVLFDQQQSVDKAITKPVLKERSLCSLKKDDGSAITIPTGFKCWVDQYKKRFISEEKLTKEINEFMLSFDESKANKDKEEKDKTNQPDEEGWITVTSKSRKANKTLTERNVQKLKTKEKKRLEKATLVNFYNFQMKDTKREYITQLRKKFEEDKKRIDTMKLSRKFKPF